MEALIITIILLFALAIASGVVIIRRARQARLAEQIRKRLEFCGGSSDARGVLRRAA